MKAPHPALEDPRFIPAIDMIRRTGAKEVQIRFSDDESPTVWMVVAGYTWRDGKPRAQGKVNRHAVGAGLDPLSAAFSLLDDTLDGGRCEHCHRVTGFEPTIDPMPLADHVCWYQWDPEMKTFRRGCEGDEAA